MIGSHGQHTSELQTISTLNSTNFLCPLVNYSGCLTLCTRTSKRWHDYPPSGRIKPPMLVPTHLQPCGPRLEATKSNLRSTRRLWVTSLSWMWRAVKRTRLFSRSSVIWKESRLRCRTFVFVQLFSLALKTHRHFRTITMLKAFKNRLIV